MSEMLLINVVVMYFCFTCVLHSGMGEYVANMLWSLLPSTMVNNTGSNAGSSQESKVLPSPTDLQDAEANNSNVNDNGTNSSREQVESR